MVTESILEVNRLNTSFFTDDGEVPAVSDVSFYIQPGEILGVVGESGCGKSVTSLSVMDLIPRPGKIVSGNIMFKGEELTKASLRRLRQISGNEIALILHELIESLHTSFTIAS